MSLEGWDHIKSKTTRIKMLWEWKGYLHCKIWYLLKHNIKVLVWDYWIQRNIYCFTGKIRKRNHYRVPLHGKVGSYAWFAETSLSPTADLQCCRAEARLQLMIREVRIRSTNYLLRPWVQFSSRVRLSRVSIYYFLFFKKNGLQVCSCSNCSSFTDFISRTAAINIKFLLTSFIVFWVEC